MGNIFQGTWWVLLLRGLLALVIGGIVLLNIQGGVMAVLLFLGYYLIIEGLLKFSQAYIQYKSGDNLWPDLLAGLGFLILGILVFVLPKGSAIVLVALVATSAIIQGISDLYTAFKNRQELTSGRFFWLIFGGVAQVAFGIWMALQPVIGGLTVVVVIGLYAIIVGIVLIVRAIQERSGRGGSGRLAVA